MNPSAHGPVQRPSLTLLGAEPFRAALEFARHHLATTNPSKRGDGHPVVIFPGLGADGSSVATLREHCRSLGYEAFDWGQGLNTGPHGDLDTWLETLKSKLTDLLSEHEQPATLIGWSLGGLYAREIGKLMAPRLRQVITIGAPFNAQADYTHAGWLFRLLSGSSAELDPALSQRLRTPPPLRTTSIYSRTDGVVAWQTCRHEKRSRLVHDIEVGGSHMGMGWNREVLDVVTDRLGQEPGPWRRYVHAHETVTDRGKLRSAISAMHGAALIAMALALGACSKAPAEPPAPMTMPVQTETAPAVAGGQDTSVPDAGSVPIPSVAPKADPAAGRSNGAMSRAQESSAMPLPGQNNDHSAPLPPAKRASGT